jgi:DNA-binding XRE family transcriptional regulator
MRFHVQHSTVITGPVINGRRGYGRPAKLKVMKEKQGELGKRIRQLRIRNGYTQESFADKCGLHRNFMGAVERGEQNLTLKTPLIIATGLGTNMAKLLAGLE